jgi:hypothetical protein
MGVPTKARAVAVAVCEWVSQPSLRQWNSAGTWPFLALPWAAKLDRHPSILAYDLL